MIVTGHPLASDAGEAMLARGGSVIDAMVAAQLVLNLVEPQSSGIGGGALHALLGRQGQGAHQLRRPRDGATGRRAGPVPATRRHGHAVRDGGGRRPLGRRARDAGPARAGAPAARPAALGRSGGARGRARRQGLRDLAAAGHGHCRQRRQAEAGPGDAGLLPGWRRGATPGRGDAAEPGVRGDPAPDRGRGQCSVLSRPDRRCAGRGRAPGAGQPGPAQPRGSGRLPGGAARAGLPPLPRLRCLRHGSAHLGRGRGAADSGPPGAFRHGRARPVGGRDAGAARSLEAGVRRPQPLPRRHRLRPRAGQGAARSGLSDGAGAADPAGCLHGQGRRRQPALARGRAPGTRREREAAGHQPAGHHRRRRQRPVDDHDDREQFRQRSHGRRLSAQQRADRLLGDAERRTAGRSPTGSSPASGRAARWRRPSCSTRAGTPAC